MVPLPPLNGPAALSYPFVNCGLGFFFYLIRCQLFFVFYLVIIFEQYIYNTNVKITSSQGTNCKQ